MFWEKIFGDARRTADTADSDYLPVAELPDIVSAETLSGLAASVDAQLKAIEGLVRQSGHDARRFSRSLEKGATQMSDPAHAQRALEDLVGMTRDMVEKTRQVEHQLRRRTEEMALLNEGLDEARKEARGSSGGLRNRREFERELGSAVERARLSGDPVSLVLCDIDGFAAISDAHGVETANRVIAFVGTLLDQSIDNRGMVCRGIGAEFLILFDGHSSRQARDITEEARQALIGRNIVDRQSGRRVGHVNFSAGIASIGGDANISLMFARADRALQRARTSAPGTVKIAY